MKITIAYNKIIRRKEKGCLCLYKLCFDNPSITPASTCVLWSAWLFGEMKISYYKECASVYTFGWLCVLPNKFSLCCMDSCWEHLTAVPLPPVPSILPFTEISGLSVRVEYPEWSFSVFISVMQEIIPQNTYLTYFTYLLSNLYFRAALLSRTAVWVWHRKKKICIRKH